MFLNLELMQLDQNGFWPELYDESFQPTPHFTMPPEGPYGTLPRRVWHSKRMKRMLLVPPGTPAIFEESRPADPQGAQGVVEEALPLPPADELDNSSYEGP